MNLKNSLLAALLTCLSLATPAAPLDEAGVSDFIAYMVASHGFDQQSLNELFAGAERSERILELMTRPAEKVKPWWEYRNLFISDKRIRDGVAFWHENQDALMRAQAEYGVAPEVIVAIIGVETSYGRITGGYRVLDALSTLAFHYPGGNESRARFFRAQLEHFLLFAREDGLDPTSLTGSYAGAMGMPQFMPENYRKLAVDFDADGARDIWGNPRDAIGSVANYLNRHGWLAGGPIVSPAALRGDPAPWLQDEIKPTRRVAEFSAAGITPMVAQDPELPAALFELQARDGKEYWLGFTNFYVISRYNPRVKYAMAVAHLAAAIRDLRDEHSS